jgi:hypothetical protein
MSPRIDRGQKPDGRSSGARRYRAIVAAFTAEIGHNLTESESGLVRQAAALALRCEQLQAAIVRGEAVDDDLLVRISGPSKRLLGAISVRSQGKKPSGPTMLDYMAQKAAERTASDDVDDI